MGTWIEITGVTAFYPTEKVVPLVGTWIEIKAIIPKSAAIFVVPLVGTWIEMSGKVVFEYPALSFPSWERGLKLIQTSMSGLLHCRSPRGNVD